jgi:hypothetical protein
MKDAFSFENIAKLIGSLWVYFGLLATPEKIIVVTLAFMTICVFCFSVWAYFQMRKSDSQTAKLLDIFEKRFLLTESRANLLTDIHVERHPEDGAKFFKLERLAAQNRFEELQDGAISGSCRAEKKD